MVICEPYDSGPLGRGSKPKQLQKQRFREMGGRNPRTTMQGGTALGNPEVDIIRVPRRPPADSLPIAPNPNRSVDLPGCRYVK